MTQKDKNIQGTALAIESMVELEQQDKWSMQRAKMEIAQLKNKSSAMARYMAEDGRHMAMATLTFGKNSRVDFQRISEKKILEVAKTQYNSLMGFLYRMRNSKRFKHDIRYFAVVEVQPEGGALHVHIAISVANVDEMFTLVEFVQDFKGRYTKPYVFKSKPAFPIDRSHIGLTSMLQKEFADKYRMNAHKAKGDATRTEYYLPEIEQREFKSGSWTPIEFYTKTMMMDRYEEDISNYLTKTIEGEFELDKNSIKEGVVKCQLGHDTKSLHNESYINQLHVAFVRKAGGKVYTHSRFPFPWKLYQIHRKSLITYNKKYKIFYSCIESIRSGELVIKNSVIFDNAGNIIAGEENAK
jgi:hypothetical protein